MTIDIPKLGTMACLNADGLRTLLRTCVPEIPNMFEKNLRYPEYDAATVQGQTGVRVSRHVITVTSASISACI